MPTEGPSERLRYLGVRTDGGPLKTAEGPLKLSGSLSCRCHRALRLVEGLLRPTEGPLMPSEILLGLAWSPVRPVGALSGRQRAP